jgi:hypothetical protein
MRVLVHGTVIRCQHQIPALIRRLGHPLTIAGDAALTAEEIEAVVPTCAPTAAVPTKCTKLTVRAGRADRLRTAASGRPHTPVLETLEVSTEAGPCTVIARTGASARLTRPAPSDRRGRVRGERVAEDDPHSPVKTYTASLAALSWIDPRSRFWKLPLYPHDNASPGPVIDRSVVLGRKAYRFANFLEASISVRSTIDTAGKTHYEILDAEVSPESGLHMNTSAFGTRPEAWRNPPKSELVPERLLPSGRRTPPGRKITHIVGCRTEAPEKVAELVGCAAGVAAARSSPLLSLFDRVGVVG